MRPALDDDDDDDGGDGDGDDDDGDDVDGATAAAADSSAAILLAVWQGWRWKKGVPRTGCSSCVMTDHLHQREGQDRGITLQHTSR